MQKLLFCTIFTQKEKAVCLTKPWRTKHSGSPAFSPLWWNMSQNVFLLTSSGCQSLFSCLLYWWTNDANSQRYNKETNTKEPNWPGCYVKWEFTLVLPRHIVNTILTLHFYHKHQNYPNHKLELAHFNFTARIGMFHLPVYSSAHSEQQSLAFIVSEFFT